MDEHITDVTLHLLLVVKKMFNRITCLGVMITHFLDQIVMIGYGLDSKFRTCIN